MSERQKSKTSSEKAPFLRAARQLLAETARVTRSEKIVPKRARWQYAYEIMWLANQYHSWAMYANGIKVQTRGLMLSRYEAQTRALGWLYALDAKMSAAQLCMNINADLLTHWAQLLNAEYAGDGPIRTMDKFYTTQFRQRPDYKRKRRYLYGNRHDPERKNPPAGGRERAADGEERNAGGASGLCGHDDRRGSAGGGDEP